MLGRRHAGLQGWAGQLSLCVDFYAVPPGNTSRGEREFQTPSPMPSFQSTRLNWQLLSQHALVMVVELVVVLAHGACRGHAQTPRGGAWERGAESM